MQLIFDCTVPEFKFNLDTENTLNSKRSDKSFSSNSQENRVRKWFYKEAS